jgi:hypothetical protein
MGNIFKRLFKRKVVVSQEIEKIEEKSIYKKLARLLELVEKQDIKLDAKVSMVGTFQSHLPDLKSLYVALMEINDILKEQTHIEGTIFTVGKKEDVYLDIFLYTNGGNYLAEPNVVFTSFKFQIKEYLNYMKDADQAKHGYMDHNHRRLFSFTRFLSDFLEVLLRNYE